MAERDAALAYWQAWAPLEFPFVAADRCRVAEHWRTFGQRGSTLTSSSRLAVNPINAILNYLYALLEAEATIACHAVGLDPNIGVVHADIRGRDSLALDLMEPIRPEAEHYLLNVLADNTFRARDFHEAPNGNCRVRAPLTYRLAETLPTWTTLLAPVAETVARRLAKAADIEPSPTPLTQSNRRSGHATLGHTTRQPAARPPRLRTCKTCGVQLASAGRVFCDDCLPEARAQQRAEFAHTGPSVLANLRAANADPAHGGAATARRAATMRQRQRERAEWRSDSGQVNDPGKFTREILPLIQNVPLRRLSRETGLSLRYVAVIRRGERVPHPRHWQKLGDASRLL